jgi:hypothetical protein
MRAREWDVAAGLDSGFGGLGGWCCAEFWESAARTSRSSPSTIWVRSVQRTWFDSIHGRFPQGWCRGHMMVVTGQDRGDLASRIRPASPQGARSTSRPNADLHPAEGGGHLAAARRAVLFRAGGRETSLSLEVRRRQWAITSSSPTRHARPLPAGRQSAQRAIGIESGHDDDPFYKRSADARSLHGISTAPARR